MLLDGVISMVPIWLLRPDPVEIEACDIGEDAATGWFSIVVMLAALAEAESEP